MNFNCPLILASSSPRRRFLLSELGFTFTSVSPDIDETFPERMQAEQVPAWLAEKKAMKIDLDDQVVVAADTVVILDNMVLNKPDGRDDAIRMLTELAGKTHKVITAVCVRGKKRTDVVDDTTFVKFRSLTRKEIEFYVDHFKPFDKAGAYGAQDCLPPSLNPCSEQEIKFLDSIGNLALIQKSITTSGNQKRTIIIDRIEGSYFTVMGLPVHVVVPILLSFNQGRAPL